MWKSQHIPFFLLLVAISLPFRGEEPSPAHPLDPLSQEEMKRVVQALQKEMPEHSEISLLVLKEPPKEEVLRYKDRDPFRRDAFVVIYDRSRNRTFEAVVDASQGRVLQWKQKDGVQPIYLGGDADTARLALCISDEWRNALLKRDIHLKGVERDCEKEELKDPTLYIDFWAGGNYEPERKDEPRFLWAVPYYTGGANNVWARPIEGLTARVKVNGRKEDPNRVKVSDTASFAIPKATWDFKGQSGGPCHNTEPTAESGIEVIGHEVHWQNWSFRYAMHPREGLVLYNVGYRDQGRVRSVLYRASLSEMVVPYADRGPGWFFRNAFDEGEYGMGLLVNSLKRGGDIPLDAATFSAVTSRPNAGTGEVGLTDCAVAMYVRDGDVLWRHYEDAIKLGEKTESVRARDLVVKWFATVGNYDYGFNWIFHQDGTIEMDIVLTGVDEPKGADRVSDTHPDGDSSSSAHLVAANVEAVHHQHFFNFRLDMDLDTPSNSVVEMNTEPGPPHQRNPNGAFTESTRTLRSEKEARRNLDLASSRVWKIVNPSVLNHLGQPVGYVLVPGENSGPYAPPSSPVRKRAGFLDWQLWVTPYRPEEMYAAGDYVNQSRGGDGLPRWTADNRRIDNRDIVLWYTVGITHIPRPEDWPVMPAHHAGFKLVPDGFFDHNPSLIDGIATPIPAGASKGDTDLPHEGAAYEQFLCRSNESERANPMRNPETSLSCH